MLNIQDVCFAGKYKTPAASSEARQGVFINGIRRMRLFCRNQNRLREAWRHLQGVVLFIHATTK